MKKILYLYDIVGIKKWEYKKIYKTMGIKNWGICNKFYI